MGNRQQSAKKQTHPESTNKPQSQNKFELLNSIMEEGEGSEFQKNRRTNKVKCTSIAQKKKKERNVQLKILQTRSQEMRIWN